MTNPIRLAAGALRVMGHAARGMAYDAANAVAHTAQTAVRAASDEPTGLATLRMHLVILSDEKGRPLVQPVALGPALRRADEVFQAGARIRVRCTRIRTVKEPAPKAALDPRANRALLLDHVMGKTDFISRHVGRPPLLSPVGDPITVVIVRKIAGNATACSLGGTADWVICQASLFNSRNSRTYDETVLAHELGHAMNLPHLRDPANLMHPMSTAPDRLRGVELRSWQAAIIRANRHVVPSA